MKNVPLPTISDIAAAAGVSTATVSRVLGGKGSTSDALRQRVLEATQKLGYQPQRLHRRNQGGPMVLALTESPIDAFFSQILAAIQEACLERGWLAYVVQMAGNGERKDEIMRRLKRGSWLGIISVGFYMSPEKWVQFSRALGVPLVLMNTVVDHPGVASLLVDFEGTAATAIQHLLDLGHRHIAYLGDLSSDFSLAEFRGVKNALARRGLEYPSEYHISVPHTPEGASQGIGRLMMLPAENRPTALLTFDDEFAIHVLNALRYYALRVPDDVSVVGFDNIPMSAHTHPALTTIDVPKYRIGRQLTVLLEQLLGSGGKPVGKMIVPGSLTVRGSSGRVPWKEG